MKERLFMKNTMACLGVIALLAVIGFASCSNGTTDVPEPEFIVHTYKSVKNEITYILEIFQPFEESAADGEMPAAYTPAAGDTYKLTIIYPDGATVTSSGTVALSSTTSGTAIFSLSNGVNLKVTITRQGALTVISGTIIPDPTATGSPIQGEPSETPQPITAPGAVTSDGNGSPPLVNYAPTTVAVTGVTLNTSSLSLSRSGTATLAATVNPSNATNKTVTWTSSNTAVATVSNGTVTAVSTGSATITVTTQDGGKTATCVVTVSSPSGTGGTGGTGTAPTINTTTLANGTVGTAYSQTLTATGSTPITWSIDTGALPGGLNLSTAGVISGMPTTANTFNFTVKAANATGSGTKALSIVIASGGTGGTGNTPVKTLTSITAVYTPTTDIFPDITHDTLKEGLIVTAHYSDNTTAAVTAYTLSGDFTVGESDITVSYAEGGVTKTAAFTITVKPGHAHIWGAWTVATPATCSAKGLEKQECTVGGTPHHEDREIPINPDAHNWNNSYTVTTPVTCSATGIETDTCTRNAAHTRTRIAAIDPNAHNYTWTAVTAPTCTTAGSDNGICSYNAAHTTTRIVAINPDAHNYNWTPVTVPTCTTAGSDSGTCAYNAAHTTTRTVAINPNAHEWNTAYTTITAATVTTDGVEAITCQHNASHTKDKRTQYATGTAGLDFKLNGSTYRVHNKDTTNGTATGAIVIPAYHRPDADSPYLPVTEIGNDTNSSTNNAFGGQSGGGNANTTVTSISFAEGSQLTTISNYAFNYCTNLANVTIPASVTSIGQGAFYACSSLTGINIPAGTIGQEAFRSCNNLANVIIGAGVTSIGSSAFYQLTNLANVTFTPNSQLTTIGQSAFYGCSSLTSITIPAGTIGETAFRNCTNLASVIIGAGVRSIGSTVFQGCNRLTDITIPAGTIGGAAFYQCTNLANVTIGAGVTSIGNGAFQNLAHLASVTFAPNSQLTMIDNNAFSGCSVLTSVTIPASVTTINLSAFSGCTGLTDITIPNNVATIGSWAFQNCTNLASVTFVGTISTSGFNANAFQGLGDLRDKYLTGGGPGTYTTTAPVSSTSVWTKQ
jgi:hypothetical protein